MAEYQYGGIAIVGEGSQELRWLWASSSEAFHASSTSRVITLLRVSIPRVMSTRTDILSVGAGVAFAPNAVRAMKACNPDAYTSFKAVATHNLWESKCADLSQGRKGVYFDFMDGFHDDDKLLFSLLNDEGANSVHRAHFLEAMVTYLPEGLAHFRKRVERVEDVQNGPVTLFFADGTTATADAVIGADGIRSHVRQSLLSAEKPESHANYTYKYCYRGLIPMEKAKAALGEDMAVNSKMHLGPNGHILTMPIDKGKTMNVVAFTTTKQDWNSQKPTSPSTKEAALNDFVGWGKTVMHILSLLDEKVDIWAIFDMLDHPAPLYAKDRVCITGDAAHATSPHQDSAVLSELLSNPAAKTPSGLRAVFQAFDQCRRARTQWLVASSRRAGELYEWQAQGTEADIEKIAAELHDRYEKIWQGDITQMIREAQEALQKLLVYAY